MEVAGKIVSKTGPAECEHLPESYQSCNQSGKNLIPDGMYHRRSDEIFITFPESLRNFKAERLSNANALLINFIIFPLHLATEIMCPLGILCPQT